MARTMPDGTPPAYSIFQIAEEELMPDAYSIFHITEGAHTERKNSDVAEWARPPLLASSPPIPLFNTRAVRKSMPSPPWHC